MPESDLLVVRVVAWLMGFFNRLLRAGLFLGALLLVVLALYVSLGRELMPLLAEYRTEVEREVQAAIGMPLHIGRLEGSWRDFSPLLVAHDVELGEGAGRIYLQTLRLKLDPLRSLLGRRLEIQRLELGGLQLTVAQAAQGGWSVAGLPPPANASATASPEEALGTLLGISQLLLLDSQITLQPFDGKLISLTNLELELRNGLRQRLDGHLNLPDGLPVSFSLRGKLNPADWRNSTAKLYLGLPQSDWSTHLPPALLPGWTLDRLTAGGEFWAVVEDGQLQHLVARLNAQDVQAAAAGRKAVEVQDLAVTAYLDRHPEGYDLRLESLAMSLDQTRFGPVQLQVQRRQPAAASAPTWQLQADRLDLAPLATLAASLAPPEPVVDEWLAGLEPHGQVRNIQVTFDEQKTTSDRLQFAANLTAVGISAYSDVPGLENVTGLISGDLGQGALRLNTEDFVLNLAAVFPAPWRYFKAGALLAWTLDDQAFSLHSPYFRLEGEEGRIAGDLKIAIPFAADEDSYMDLRVGLSEGDAAFVSKYLPLPSEDFSVELADWLKTAIVSGGIDQGLFQYQGTLSAAAPEISSTLSLYFKVHALELAYEPGWPALREAAGEVLVDSSGVKANVSSGKILDSSVSQVYASVLPTTKGQIPHLKLTADLQSSVKDVLTILQTAPLEADYTFDGWNGEGALAGKLSLDIPLEGSTEPHVVVDVAANGASLSMPEPPLKLTQIVANLRFNSASGLSAPSIRARVLNQAVTGKIVAEGAHGKQRTRIEVASKVALKDLIDLLGISGQQLPVAGTIPYQLNLVLDDKSRLQVDSSLQGLSVDLPAPFGKPADEVRATQFNMLLDDREPVYRAKYAELASLALALPNGKLQAARAELVLGGQSASVARRVWTVGARSVG